MKFEHVSIYNGVGFKKKLKAPTDHCFVLKVFTVTLFVVIQWRTYDTLPTVRCPTCIFHCRKLRTPYSVHVIQTVGSSHVWSFFIFVFVLFFFVFVFS